MEDDGSKDDAWDADAVRFADALLAHGADPGAADDCGATAIHLAAAIARDWYPSCRCRFFLFAGVLQHAAPAATANGINSSA